jgi:XXXCH domain-containing protein
MTTDSGKKQKTKRIVSRLEAVSYLRKLADELEDGAIHFSSGDVDIQDQIKLKETLKAKKDHTTIKVQFKLHSHEQYPEEAAPSAPATEPSPEPPAQPSAEKAPASFKAVKKRMQSAFKVVSKDLEAGGTVDMNEVRDFHDACVQMVSFTSQGKGDPVFPEFKAQADALLGAAESGDTVAMKDAVLALKALKKSCHKEFK